MRLLVCTAPVSGGFPCVTLLGTTISGFLWIPAFWLVACGFLRISTTVATTAVIWFIGDGRFVVLGRARTIFAMGIEFVIGIISIVLVVDSSTTGERTVLLIPSF